MPFATGAAGIAAKGAGNRSDALWAGRIQGTNAEGSGAKNGDFPILYFQIGEKNHVKVKKRDIKANKLRLTIENGYAIIDMKFYR